MDSTDLIIVGVLFMVGAAAGFGFLKILLDQGRRIRTLEERDRAGL